MNKDNKIQVWICICYTASMKVYSVIPFIGNLDSTETKQMIWDAKKLTDLFMIWVHTKRYFQRGYINSPNTHLLSQYYNYDNIDNNNNNNKNYNNKSENGKSHLTHSLSFYLMSH